MLGLRSDDDNIRIQLEDFLRRDFIAFQAQLFRGKHTSGNGCPIVHDGLGGEGIVKGGALDIIHHRLLVLRDIPHCLLHPGNIGVHQLAPGCHLVRIGLAEGLTKGFEGFFHGIKVGKHHVHGRQPGIPQGSGRIIPRGDDQIGRQLHQLLRIAGGGGHLLQLGIDIMGPMKGFGIGMGTCQQLSCAHGQHSRIGGGPQIDHLLHLGGDFHLGAAHIGYDPLAGGGRSCLRRLGRRGSRFGR
ncbi:hypothetical protein D3C75_728680 [compost metagenome]